MPGAQSSTRTLVPKETRTILGFRAYFREKARPRARPNVSPTATPKLRTAAPTLSGAHSSTRTLVPKEAWTILRFRASFREKARPREEQNAGMKELCDIHRLNFRFCRGAQVGTCHSFFPFDVLAVLPINLKSKQIITRIVINYVVTKYVVIK